MRWISTEATHITILLLCYAFLTLPRPHFYQTRSAWSMDQGSTKKRSAAHNFVPTVTKFWVMWEGLSLPHDTKFGNCRGEIVDRRVIFIWFLIHGSSWSGLIKVGPGRVRLSILSPQNPFSWVYAPSRGVLHVSLPLHLGTWCIKRCHSHCRNRLISNIIRMVFTSWLAA